MRVQILTNRQGSAQGTQESTSDNETDEGTPACGVQEGPPCVDRWVNLGADSRKKMWGTFDETGIFPATCRHGIVLLICDMIQSGEL